MTVMQSVDKYCRDSHLSYTVGAYISPKRKPTPIKKPPTMFWHYFLAILIGATAGLWLAIWSSL